jgi:hypothetical protein
MPLAGPALAVAPKYPDIMPLSQVRPGMVGYGLTTFKGTTISRFQVTVIGILRKENAGHDLILIRMSGGPITERGANLIHGMSGSPIYINDKIIGAFSMGEQFPKEPLGMVTPIEDMLEAWDPGIPQEPTWFDPAAGGSRSTGTTGGKAGVSAPGRPRVGPGGGTSGNRVGRVGSSLLQAAHAGDGSDPLREAARYSGERVAVLDRPIVLGGRVIRRLVLNASPLDPRQSSAGIAVLRRATSYLTVSGIGERGRRRLQDELNRLGYALTVSQMGGSAGGAPQLRTPTLRPGSAFGTFLSAGDVQIGATGTVTYRRGNRILGYGHPLLGLGAIEAAVTSAYIVDIFSGLQSSHHIAVAGPVIGALRQDRNFSVSAELGAKPRLIPFDVTVRDATNHRTQTFHTEVFQHPELTPVLLHIVADEAIERVHDVPGDVMARVTTTVEAAELGSISRSNVCFDSDAISGPAAADLADIMSIVSGNPFYPLPVTRARMTVDLYSGHDTATVDRIFVNQGKFAPSDTIDVGVVLKPYRRDAELRSIKIKIPADTPTGRYQLQVRGGQSAGVRLGGAVLIAVDMQAPAVSARQMVKRLQEREQNTDLVARLILNTFSPTVEGERLSELPPNLAAVMRSERDSGVRLERDEVRKTLSTGYVLAGAQQLLINVVRKNSQEPGAAAGQGGPPFAGPPGANPAAPMPGGPGGSVGSAGDEPADDTPQSPDAHSAMPAGDRWSLRLDSSKGSPPKRGKASRGGDKDADADADAAKPAAGDGSSVPSGSGGAADRPVGRQLQIWRQSARSDFGPGQFNGTSVTEDGDLRLAPALRRLVGTAETYVWCLIPDGRGGFFAGTGSHGRILHIDMKGACSTFAELPEVAAQSLVRLSSGALVAGSGANGNIYYVSTAGLATQIGSIPENYILALAADRSGAVYVGPGGGGTVYKITGLPTRGSDAPKPATIAPFFKSSAQHVMALALDSRDRLYVGTGDNGVLYRCAADGSARVVYDARENAITALAIDPNGNVYAGTGPKGILYRIAPSGAATVLYDRATSFFTGLQVGPDRAVYASTLNAVYRISSASDTEATVQPLDNPKDVDFLCVAATQEGVLAGTGNVAEIYSARTAQPDASSSGTFQSVVHDARLQSRWGSLRWTASAQNGARVQIETRTGDASEPDGTWSSWSAVTPRSLVGDVGVINSPPARFIQYRVTLTAGSNGAQPGLHDVSISYLPRNQAPRVTIQTPAGGERWSRLQTLRWAGDDPDHDTLTYSLFYSSDAGATWKPLPIESRAAGSGQPAADSSQDLQSLESRLNGDKTMPAKLRQEILATAKRQLGGASDDAQAGRRPSASGAGAPAGLHDGTRSWDTRALPDGVYRLKVKASDAESNPGDAQTGEAVSEPFVVCNTPPRLTIVRQQIGATDRRITIEGTAEQSLIAVTAVQYRVDGGDWIAAQPASGMFDSGSEKFVVLSEPVSAGTHKVEVETFNAAGGSVSQTLSLTVP